MGMKRQISSYEMLLREVIQRSINCQSKTSTKDCHFTGLLFINYSSSFMFGQRSFYEIKGKKERKRFTLPALFNSNLQGSVVRRIMRNKKRIPKRIICKRLER